MTDTKKFKFLIILTTFLIIIIVAYNVLQEYFMTEIGDYLQRRIYYERIISKKGLGLHKGMHWREKE